MSLKQKKELLRNLDSFEEKRLNFDST